MGNPTWTINPDPVDRPASIRTTAGRTWSTIDFIVGVGVGGTGVGVGVGVGGTGVGVGGTEVGVGVGGTEVGVGVGVGIAANFS